MSADDQRAAERCRDADWTSVPCEPVCRRCGRDLPDGSEAARLRAELAETRAAGDALAAAALVVDEHWQDDCVTREQVECLLRTAQAWRSVRGDAPAPAAASSGAAGSNLEDAPAEHPTDRPRLRKLLDQLSRRTITASGAVELTGLCEALLRLAPADAPAEPPPAGERWRVGRRNPHNVYLQHADEPRGMDEFDGDTSLGYFRLPGDAATAVAAVNARPPAGLPVTLSSPDDVAAVCLAHGLTVRSSGPGWTQWRDPDTKVVVRCEAWQSGVERVTVAGRAGADIYRPVARRTVVAAIEAARGGFR